MTNTAATTTSSTGLVFYDIAFKKPYEHSTCAPNPWKARYALNFKGLPFTTHWTLMPNITEVRKSIGLGPGRKFADGTDYYTLPILTDSATGTAVGETLEIAAYLEKQYPNAGAGNLFPDQDLEFSCTGQPLVPLSERNDAIHPNYARFNEAVDMAFTIHVALSTHGMRFDPEIEEEVRAIFVKRASSYGVTSWEAFGITGEAREKMMISFKDTLKNLAIMYKRDDSGPFILGTQPSYADLIVGGWLRLMSKALPASDWKELSIWHDGVFGRLHDELQHRFAKL